jgi:hypothetical protein
MRLGGITVIRDLQAPGGWRLVGNRSLTRAARKVIAMPRRSLHVVPNLRRHVSQVRCIVFGDCIEMTFFLDGAYWTTPQRNAARNR